jgi:hypothetical protein
MAAPKPFGPDSTRSVDEPNGWLHAGYSNPDFITATSSSLDQLGELKPNWDGYGAPAIRSDIIAAAKRFIAALPANLIDRPRVVPMSTGNLQFEWHDRSKILELEFETPESIHYLRWHPESGVEEENVIATLNIDAAVELIHWFTSGTKPA